MFTHSPLCGIILVPPCYCLQSEQMRIAEVDYNPVVIKSVFMLSATSVSIQKLKYKLMPTTLTKALGEQATKLFYP